MIVYDAGNKATVAILGSDRFSLDTFDVGICEMSRNELSALRSAIDQALNTSAEEIADDLA